MPSFKQFKGQSVISVKEARKLLGQKAKNLTNEELETLIVSTETLVRISLRHFIGSKNSDKSARMSSNKVSKV